MPDPVAPAEFESGVAGRPVYRIVDTADPGRLAAALDACPHHVIAKVAAADLATANLLAERGFRLCCVSTELEWRHAPPGITAAVEPMTADDLEPAFAIGDDAFGAANRYADDPGLAAFAAAIHRRWLANSLAGYADHCIKVVADGRLAGFATLHLAPPAASIGLIAVDARLRRHRLGHALFARLAQLAGDAGCQTMRVVTESANAPALAFYGRCGFQAAGSQLSFYRVAQCR